MNPYAIFDLDGCLSDDRYRRGLLPKQTPEELTKNGPLSQGSYHAYHSSLGEDLPANTRFVTNQVDRGHDLLFITARPERYRQETTDWLLRNFGDDLRRANWHLLMRPVMGAASQKRSPELKIGLLLRHFGRAAKQSIVQACAAAYDDRSDVLSEYAKLGIENTNLLRVEDAELDAELSEREAEKTTDEAKEVNINLGGPSVAPVHESAAGALRRMACTYEERNAVYGDNFRSVGPLMKILFPDGAPAEVLHTDQFHLFELILVKLSRFANSGLTHEDSVHDAGVYCAMIESILKEKS